MVQLTCSDQSANILMRILPRLRCLDYMHKAMSGGMLLVHQMRATRPKTVNNDTLR